MQIIVAPRRYVHRGIFAFEVVKYWLVNEKRKCTSATSFEKSKLKNNWPIQRFVVVFQAKKKRKEKNIKVVKDDKNKS